MWVFSPEFCGDRGTLEDEQMLQTNHPGQGTRINHTFFHWFKRALMILNLLPSFFGCLVLTALKWSMGFLPGSTILVIFQNPSVSRSH